MALQFAAQCGRRNRVHRKGATRADRPHRQAAIGEASAAARLGKDFTLQWDAPSPASPHPGRGRSRGRSSAEYFGLLVSCALHLLILICLALLLGPVRAELQARFEIALSVEAEETLPEFVEFELPDPGAPTKQTLTFALADDLLADMTPPAPPSPPQPSAGAPSSAGGSGPRGSFFGTVAYGNRFVYVLDISGSMGQVRDSRDGRTRLDCAIEELLYSLRQLTEDQSFYVTLFSTDTRPMFDEETLVPELLPATAENIRRLEYWLASVRAGGNTDPRLALQRALQSTPSAVFLLSDGAFNGHKKRMNAGLLRGNPTEPEVVAASNTNGSPVHTFSLEDGSNRKRMEELSQLTGGEYVYIPPIPGSQGRAARSDPFAMNSPSGRGNAPAARSNAPARGGNAAARPAAAVAAAANAAPTVAALGQDVIEQRERARNEAQAAAMLRNGRSQERRRRLDLAEQRYQEIVKQYPGTDAAAEAKARLEALGGVVSGRLP